MCNVELTNGYQEDPCIKILNLAIVCASSFMGHMTPDPNHMIKSKSSYILATENIFFS